MIRSCMSLITLFRSYIQLLLITLSGYTVILVGLLVLAVQLSNEIDDFTSQTNKLYQHPFQVNSAARIVRQSMSTMRSQILSAIADNTNVMRTTFANEIDNTQADLNESLQIIQENFLGEPEKIDEALSLALILQESRSSIIRLLTLGQTAEAQAIINNRSTPAYNELLKRIDYVVEYSTTKAVFLVAETQKRGQASRTKFWLLLGFFALFTLFSGSITATIVLKNIYKRDITLRQANENLRIAATAFETQEGMMVTDANDIILRVNSAFTKITGYKAEEVIGHKPNILSSGRQSPMFYTQMWVDIDQYGYWEGEVVNRRKNGELYPQKLTITAVKDVNAVISTYVGTLNDITTDKQAEKEIADLAYYDPLTRLPNRRLLVDRLHHALVTHKRNANTGALMFLDLDHFKTLNDTLGHDMGDQLLKQVANRLIGCIRESDTVSRFGGDEFVILLEALSPRTFLATAQVESIANKILSAINKPYNIAGQAYTSSTSIGITLFTGKKVEVEELLKQADIALYQAKDDGRNALRFFDPQMQKDISARAVLEKELNRAIQLEQFELYYQVQVTSSITPIGAEALLRWNHPSRGIISPLKFIPVAEQNGSILAIGQWVLEAACAQLQRWQENSSTRSLTLAINVSVKQFHQHDFVETIKSALSRYKVRPELLKLELTETILLEDISGTIVKMQQLSKLGIQFSLDDFGTGYSSLQYLKQLPLHQLKIDKSFVDGLGKDGCDQEIVRTIISMAHNLGLSVIAEGVEDEKQLAALADEGCRHYQGYLFGKPEKITEFESHFTSPYKPSSNLYKLG